MTIITTDGDFEFRSDEFRVDLNPAWGFISVYRSDEPRRDAPPYATFNKDYVIGVLNI